MLEWVHSSDCDFSFVLCSLVILFKIIFSFFLCENILMCVYFSSFFCLFLCAGNQTQGLMCGLASALPQPVLLRHFWNVETKLLHAGKSCKLVRINSSVFSLRKGNELQSCNDCCDKKKKKIILSVSQVTLQEPIEILQDTIVI